MLIEESYGCYAYHCCVYRQCQKGFGYHGNLLVVGSYLKNRCAVTLVPPRVTTQDTLPLLVFGITSIVASVDVEEPAYAAPRIVQLYVIGPVAVPPTVTL